jgi:ankyrin repeat protein
MSANQLKLMNNLNKYKNTIQNTPNSLINNINRYDNFKDKYNNTILHIAIQENWIPIIDILLSKNGNYFNSFNDDGNTPLMLAIKEKLLDIIDKLLNNANIDLNLQNDRGKTPLMIAIDEDSPDIALKILDKPNVKLNIGDKNGNTVLYYAINKRYEDIIDKILDKSVEYINIRNRSGQTPLMHAININESDIALKILKKPGVNVNSTNINGLTALMFAISNNNIDIIDALLNYPNIDINIKDNNGLNILDYFENYLSDSDSIEFIKIITNILINIPNLEKSRENSSSAAGELKFNRKNNEPLQNLNFLEVQTLEYFKKQHKNENINKNVLSEIRKLMIDPNQGIIMGHGITLLNEVCLIPDNLVLFFPVEKDCSLSSSQIHFVNRKNTRREYVKKKLREGTGKILPGGTIISDMVIDFETFSNQDGIPENIENIEYYSYSGIITTNLHNIGVFYGENKSIVKNEKLYEKELIKINNIIEKLKNQKNIQNVKEELKKNISRQKIKYFLQFAELINEIIKIRKNRKIKKEKFVKLTTSEKEAIKNGNTNILNGIRDNMMHSHNNRFLKKNEIYGQKFRLSYILKIISEFKTRNNKNIPTLFHVYACRNIDNHNSSLSEIHSGSRLTRSKSFSLDYIKTNFNFLKKIDKKIDELKKIKNLWKKK